MSPGVLPDRLVDPAQQSPLSAVERAVGHSETNTEATSEPCTAPE
ncbi:hypothetical protein EES45_04735 [Streptomyces sp. ADI97-07]|nr:hypothetical protein EES45_04735 [Streptomyces sp. ADI97-07]